MIDPEAFEIAMAAAAPTVDPEDDEPIPLCATCAAPVGIFPEVVLNWRCRGDPTAVGPHWTYDPGHTTEVAWYLPDETPEDL